MNASLRIYRRLPRADSRQPSAVAIGNFDGVHRGHQAILQQVQDHARRHDMLSTVMTFWPHPRAFFALRNQRPELVPTQITGLRDKVLALRDLGIHQLALLRFNQALADMTPERFIDELLVRGLNTRWLLVGEDFRFGAKRAGDLDLLAKAGVRHGFQVRTLADVTDGHDRRISSSEVRTALAVGNLARTRELLGRPYRISGHVVHGRKLGRDIGFPTLNLHVPEPCAARSGVYVVRVHGLSGAALAGVASLGVRPTVTEHGGLLLETHLLNHSVDAYGKLVSIEFLEYLRDEEKFPDLSSLVAAIQQDVRSARDYFAIHGL